MQFVHRQKSKNIIIFPMQLFVFLFSFKGSGFSGDWDKMHWTNSHESQRCVSLSLKHRVLVVWSRWKSTLSFFRSKLTALITKSIFV